jgi:hypothetical protein
VDTTRGPGIRIRVGTVPKRLERASNVFDPDDHYALLLDQTGRAFVEPDERTNDDLPGSAQLATVVLREAVVQEFEHASLPRQSISTPRTARSETAVTPRPRAFSGTYSGSIPRSFVGRALLRAVDAPIEPEALIEANGDERLAVDWSAEARDTVERGSPWSAETEIHKLANRAVRSEPR